LKKEIDIYKRAIELIRLGKNDEACRLVYNSIGDNIIRFLEYKYRWNKDEAFTIFHDAYLLIESKILNNEVDSFNKTYFLSTCKFLGANKYRKSIRQNLSLTGFIKEEMKNFNVNVQNYCDLQVFSEEEELPVDWQKALRSFSMLNKKCQDYIHLKYVESLTHEQILKKNFNISTVRASITTLNRCLNRWKELLEKIPA